MKEVIHLTGKNYNEIILSDKEKMDIEIDKILKKMEKECQKK